MRVKHIPIFPVITSYIECENYNSIKDDLIAWIYQYQKTDEGVIISNRGGWQSRSDFYFEPSFIRFYDYILRHILNSIPFVDVNVTLQNMWININKKGDLNISHNHPESMLSGVFWVKTPNECGKINFESLESFNYSFFHRKAHPELRKINFDSCVEFDPKEGSILLFPANLRHMVNQNQSDEDRISIAFNIWLTE